MPGLEGTSLGRYQLLGRLGRGGMSEVYLAYDELMNRNVALKVVSSSHADYLERFHREAEAIASLHHDHILPAFDYGDQEPWHYLVMPHVEHGTLRERLDEGPLSLEDAGEMLDQIAGALQTAHDSGIIHRDIKPSNILLRNTHYAYLADFGLAKALAGGSELTQTGALLGTPEYMAPDLADGPATTSSDIYALGVLLYQMIAGRVPFTGETPVSIYMKHVREQPLPPSFYNPKIPHSIDQVVLRALEKDPRRRYQSAQELADGFERARLTPSIHETQEMQPYKTLQEAGQQSNGDTPIPASRRFGRQARQARQVRQNRTPSSQGRRLILPGNPTVAPSSIFPRRRRTAPIVDTESTAPAAVQQALANSAPYETANPVSAVPVRPLPRRRITRSIQGTHRTPKRKRVPLTTIIVVLGLLLFIVIPMVSIYYAFVTTPHKAPVQPTATTGAVITAQPTRLSGVTPTGQPPSNPAATATVQAVQQAQATATALGPTTSGTPILIDNLTTNTNNRWTEDAIHCVFAGNSYHVKLTQANFLQQCALSTPQMSNASVQVDVNLLSGTNAGMLLRVNGEQFYDFEINGQGQFFFRRHDPGAGSNYVYLYQKAASAAIAQNGQKNTLSVIANDNDFRLYINSVFVGEVRDGTYAHGQLALATGTIAPTNVGEASFNNLQIYKVTQ